MIKIKDVSYQYDTFYCQMDFSVLSKQKMVIVGPSGAGKSTILNLMAGFIVPNSGHIVLNNQNMSGVSPGKRPISMLFQDNNLFSHLTVQQNIALGIRASLNVTKKEQNEINLILDKVGLTGFEARYPSQLSGGQKQRIALARCLIQHRPILLLDEPFSALDQALRYEMMQLIDQICEEFDLTLVMVSHYLDESLDYFNRCLVVNEGKIIFDQTPDRLKNTASESMIKILGLSWTQNRNKTK